MGTGLPGWAVCGQPDCKPHPSPYTAWEWLKRLSISLLKRFLNWLEAWAAWPLGDLPTSLWPLYSRFKEPRAFTKLFWSPPIEYFKVISAWLTTISKITTQLGFPQIKQSHLYVLQVIHIWLFITVILSFVKSLWKCKDLFLACKHEQLLNVFFAKKIVMLHLFSSNRCILSIFNLYMTLSYSL